jgi:Arc/MetJ-type ribon-helix-helix transcriptional regulator
MAYSPHPRVQKMIDEQMKRGEYANLDDLLVAALAALDDTRSREDFSPGELDELLAEADADIEQGDVIDGEQALIDRRRRRAEQAKRAG